MPATGSITVARTSDPPWYRPGLLLLAVATAVTYLWNLGASGWANSFYSAAAQAGSVSWKAFFFGSLDSANSITVDKPPASLWLMSLSARLFGVSSWSILVPEALCGVATVVVLVLCVKRWFGPAAGLLAGLVLALTPVAALMFRFNNPDALLVLLLTAAAYAVTRAIEGASTRWLLLAGTLVGFGFLTKMLQAFIVLPVFALAYLIAAPTSTWRRVWQLAAMGAATIVAAGWWVAIVELWPASSRPYIGGSQDNSVLELVFGYNGFGRLTGNETGSVGGGGGNSGRWGQTGLLRMFNHSFGGQISWLLPAALGLLVVGLVLTARRPRTDRTRAALVLWGGWLVLTGVVFSLGQGIIHEYYSVALAPAIGALIGIGAAIVWNARAQWWTRAAAGAIVALTGWWSYTLLQRTPYWNPWLAPTALTLSLAAGAAIALVPLGQRRLAQGAVALAIVAGLLGPGAYSVATAATPHSGALPTAGPKVVAGLPGGRNTGANRPGAFPGGGTGTFPGGGTSRPPGGTGTFPNVGGNRGTGTFPGGTNGGAFPGGNRGGRGGGFPGGGLGGLLNASAPSDEVVAALEADAGDYTWVLATVGANVAAGYQLATGEPVMAIGGFNGTDPSPTLAEFQSLVAAGRIHYFVAGGSFGGSNGTATSIRSWVEQHFSTVSIGGVELYDLTSPL